MSIPIPLVAGVLLASVIAAQQDPAGSAPAPTPAAARMQALRAQQKQMNEAYAKAVREAREAAAKAKPGEATPAMPMRPDEGGLIADLEAAAKEFAGSDDAPQFLVWLAQISFGDHPEKMQLAMSTLAERHLDHPELAKLGSTLGQVQMLPPNLRGFDDAGLTALYTRLEKSANADTRGWAKFARLGSKIEDAPRDSADYKQARAELLGAIEVATNDGLKEQVTGAIEVREKYGVGCTAPDIEGEDLDGKAFKLSDYRGKVVFLDFWGDW